MKIVVIGGSAAGLSAALMLARADHDVVVIERDGLVPASDTETAAANAFRATAPQIVQPHVLLALCRELLRERLPDVYRAMLDAGVVEAPLSSQMPPTLQDRAARPGDERLTLMMTRRATVDWVLRRITASEPNVTLRAEEQVIELLAESGDPPRVVGVRTPRSDIAADIVIDAAGRRSSLDRWLEGIGARRSEVAWAECGLAYYSRQYRLRSHRGLPGPTTTRVVAPLDEFVVGIWGGDNDSMQLALAPLAVDRRFARVRDPEVFTAVLRTVPFYAAWLDALEPTTRIGIMSGLHNTLRRLVIDGTPIALGVHTVGDATCTTNPTFARGLSLMMRNAADLVDALTEHPEDLREQALAMDRAVTDNIAPWYADQAVGDTALLARLKHTIFGGPPPEPGRPSPGRVTFSDLRMAAPVDPIVFRAFFTIMGMLGHPDDTYRDPEIVTRVRGILASSGGAPRMPQPTTDELAAALGTVLA